MGMYDILAPFWNTGSKLGGLDRALNDYVERVSLSLPDNAKILEVGCGTGIVSFALLKKFKDANILATDNNRKMLKTTASIAEKRKIPQHRLRLGESDINYPFEVKMKDKGMITLLPESFDLVVASAVLEHAILEEAIPNLLQLLKPEGYLFIIAMRSDTLSGKLYSRLYHYKPVSEEIISMLIKYDYSPVIIPFSYKEFPINLRRTGFMARKL